MKSANPSYGKERNTLYVLALVTIVSWPGTTWSQSSRQCDFFVPSNPNAAIEEGVGSLINYGQADNALQILLTPAELGNSQAQLWLGFAYSGKRPPDYGRAFKWYLRSAEQGEPLAMMQLSLAYRDGLGVERDDQEADRWLEKSSSQDHDLQWYFDQAAAGNDSAQVELANNYAHVNSRWNLPLDLTEAARWYTKAANQGNARGETTLAVLYELGRGVKKDERKASVLFLESAKHGNLWSQHKIALRYEEGLGIQKDLKQAAYWYTTAVHNGSIESQFDLGRLYLTGKGVRQDYEQGWYWIKSAECFGKNNAVTPEDFLGSENGGSLGSGQRQRSAGVASNEAETLAHDLQAYRACLLEHSDDTGKCDGLEKIYKADLEIMKLLLGAR